MADIGGMPTNAVGSPAYRCESGTLPSTGETVWVIFESGHGLHAEGTSWLKYLRDLDSSPETARAYGPRLAWFLSWCAAHGHNWRKPSLSVLAKWKQALLTTPYVAGKSQKLRQPETVDGWMTALTEFYKWATANGIVDKSYTQSFYEQKFIPAGVRGGEAGRTITTKAPELSTGSRRKDAAPEWLELHSQRRAILDIDLNPRDRFLVDLLYSTGLRGGEALTLFREDLHFLQDNRSLECRIMGPHVHVNGNVVDTGARAKSSRTHGFVKRYVPVPVDLVASYEDYRFERVETLGVDTNPLVFVNLYAGVLGAGVTPDSMRDSFERLSDRLGFYVRPHMLRHTRATLWLHGVEGPKLAADTVQALLGHKSPASTLIYTHSTEEDLRAAVDGVSLRLREDTGEQK